VNILVELRDIHWSWFLIPTAKLNLQFSFNHIEICNFNNLQNIKKIKPYNIDATWLNLYILNTELQLSETFS